MFEHVPMQLDVVPIEIRPRKHLYECRRGFERVANEIQFLRTTDGNQRG